MKERRIGMRLGIDIGSTTLKCVLLGENGEILFSSYNRHFSQVSKVLGEQLRRVQELTRAEKLSVAVSGSAGMGIAENIHLPFVQEVFAEQIAVKKLDPETDVVIELGGEDAKILFLTGGFEMRMNGSCAGGTGAFIDQMAALMNVTVDEMDTLAARSEKLYTIASRCGVFAKSDVQPLLNQGAKKEDVAASIFRAVVNQTVAGLAQGREFKGNILYLGGPLSFLTQLRKSFDEVLGTKGKCPENSLYYVAMGAALSRVGEDMTAEELRKRFKDAKGLQDISSAEALFTSEEEYQVFRERHLRASEGITEITEPGETMYLGIDAGSTTVKAVLTDEHGNIFRPLYTRNNGNPVPIIKKYLEELYRDCPDIRLRASAVTGYGEAIIQNAFSVDFGIVETIAHYTAAKKFRPDVDFILDIGGQDIKCFRIKNGAIDSIYLNEACSSGCGSFLQTFAGSLGYSSEEFARLALFAKHPVDLGSRCTVFMNSSVKQAQKDGATVEDIAAGLSLSVVKNALYKVIRCTMPEKLGKNIVVQGGTFLSDAVLRAFEHELKREVIRPKFAPIMGAYGAALYAKDHMEEGRSSSLIGREGLQSFVHEVRAVTCKGCTNHCALTINTFSGGKRYIAGNRCEKPLADGALTEAFNLFADKRAWLSEYRENKIDPTKKTIGIPFGLNMYELLPFWYAFFKTLGFNVLVSPESTRKLYLRGQYTIPSDTACYPAKIMHGHIEWLLDQKPDAIFYPDMSYNVDEKLGVNHYNCPVVAYYPQVLRMNVRRLGEMPFICDFFSIADKKMFLKRMNQIIPAYFPEVTQKALKEASDAAYREYADYLERVRRRGQEYMEIARKKDLPVIVLAGRPYHVDQEISHGIDRMLVKLGAVVLTEDSVSHLAKPYQARVMNQWTYHSRLYAAAKFVTEARDLRIDLVQLISFGCGVDAITSDEVREILEAKGKIYTFIKIDEISNMGAVSIRLRSLFSAAEDKEKRK